MFSYCVEGKKEIINKIGKYMLNKLDWLDSEGSLVRVNVVNKWERKDIAEKFIEEFLVVDGSISNKYALIGGVKNKLIFIREVAYTVDELIPKMYYIKYNLINNGGDLEVISKEYMGKDNHDITSDLIYKYNCNVNKDIKNHPKGLATEKQIAYIKRLARAKGVCLKNLDKLKCGVAPKLIAYLNGRGKNHKPILKYIVNE